MTEAIRLTQYSRGAGCGCKIAPAVLQTILQKEDNQFTDVRLLVGNHTNDDAAVYDMGNGQALVSTTDFFMPVVDDAFDFGRIAAANAISDVYAMGGTPVMALAILGWPVEKLPAELAQQVLQGARAICRQANIMLAGGHSIDSTEPFFGLAVNGMVNIQHLKKNNTAKEHDVLLLTKPLGSGVLTTAQKRGVITAQQYDLLITILTTLNTAGTLLATVNEVHALTDVTGFGLLGHLIEMTEGSNLNAVIEYNKLPVMSGVKELIAQKVVPDATFRNWNSYSKEVKFEKGVNVMEAFSLLPDPQTNGGLLVAVSKTGLQQVQTLLTAAGLQNYIEPVGYFTSAASEKRITVVNNNMS
jgi:selenide, water dikinase